MAAGGQVGAEHTYRRARGTLETREATVTLYASVTLFACLTLVTTWALRSLEKGRGQAVNGRSTSTEWGAVHILTRVLRTCRP